MKKVLLVFTLILTILCLDSGIVLGNALTLQAENGIILAPAGIGFELNGVLGRKDSMGQSTSPLYEAQLSYGIAPAITIAGQFIGNPQNNGSIQTIVKAAFSPARERNGYTLYADYDLTNSKIANYGISLWTDMKFLFIYADLNANTGIEENQATFLITPGASLRVGSKVRIGGEVAVKPGDWSFQELRAGVNYFINPRIGGKFVVESGLEGHSDRVYKTGLTVELW